MIKKYWKIILVLIIVVLLAGGVYYKFYGRTESATRDKIDERLVMEVKKGNIEKTIPGEGYLQPVNSANLSFPARSGSTRIKNIYISEGDMIEKDQLLMELNETEVRLKYMRSQNNYNRVKINGSSSEIKEAELELELAEEELNNMKLRAPLAGIITDIYVEEGDYYTSGDVAVIKDTSRFEVEVNIEESDIPEIEQGQLVKMTLQSLPGKTITGRVIEIANEAVNESGTVTLPITVRLDEVDYDIKLGCSAQLDIIVGRAGEHIIIPITAISQRNGRNVVFKVVNGETEPVQVETGISDGLRIAIISGLKPGDNILINTYSQRSDFQMPDGQQSRIPGVMGGRR